MSLEDAKALREMGLPLSTPVEDRELSRKAQREIAAVFKATRAFGNSVLPWASKQTTQRYSAVSRAWNKLQRSLERVASSDPDDPETVAVDLFIEPCRLVYELWGKILTAARVEKGDPQQLTGGKAPWPLGPFARSATYMQPNAKKPNKNNS